MTRLLQKLETLERRLSARTPFTFYAVFQPEGSESWDLLVAAPWLDADDMTSRDKVTKLVVGSLAKDELLALGRIVILNADDRLLKDVLRVLPKDASLPLELNNFIFSGVKIRRGRIITAPTASVLRQMEAV